MYTQHEFFFEVIERCNGEVSYIHGKLVSHVNNHEVLYVTLVYMPRLADYRSLFEFLEKIFTSVPNGKKHILMGDFNINVRCGGSIADSYLGLLRSYGYNMANDRVTRPISGTVIDHHMINFDNTVNFTLRCSLSDHNGLLLTLPYEIPDQSSDTIDTTKTRLDLQKLRDRLRMDFIDSSCLSSLNAQEALNFVIDTIKTAVNECTTVQAQKKLKHGSKPWVDSELI